MKSTDFIKEAPVQYSTTFRGAPESHPMYNTYYQQELAKRKNLPSGEETAKIMAANRVKADMAKAGTTAFPVALGQQQSLSQFQQAAMDQATQAMNTPAAKPQMTGSKTDPRNSTPYAGPTIPQPAPVATTAPVKPAPNVKPTNTEPDETDDLRGGQSQNAPLPAGGFRSAAQATLPAAQPSPTSSAAVGANPMQPTATPAASTPSSPASQTAAKGGWREIYNTNKAVIGANPNLIKPGQQLKMPDGTTYTVKSGDSLSKIAASRNMPINAGQDFAQRNKTILREFHKLTAAEQIIYFRNIVNEAGPGTPAAQPGQAAAAPGTPAAQPGQAAAAPGTPAAQPGQAAAAPGTPNTAGGTGQNAAQAVVSRHRATLDAAKAAGVKLAEISWAFIKGAGSAIGRGIRIGGRRGLTKTAATATALALSPPGILAGVGYVSWDSEWFKSIRTALAGFNEFLKKISPLWNDFVGALFPGTTNGQTPQPDAKQSKYSTLMLNHYQDLLLTLPYFQNEQKFNAMMKDENTKKQVFTILKCASQALQADWPTALAEAAKLANQKTSPFVAFDNALLAQIQCEYETEGPHKGQTKF